MPPVVRAATVLAVGALLAGGIAAWSARGSAILMDLGSGIAQVLCL